MGCAKRCFAAAALLLATGSASALEAVVGNVILLEPTYMPDRVMFILSAGTSSCPAGQYLYWQGSAENNKAVYATLLTAISTGKQVRFHVDDGDTTCKGRFLHLVN